MAKRCITRPPRFIACRFVGSDADPGSRVEVGRREWKLLSCRFENPTAGAEVGHRAERAVPAPLEVVDCRFERGAGSSPGLVIEKGADRGQPGAA